MLRGPGGNHSRRSKDAGAALTEFSLVLPLFLATIWGLLTVSALARARLQVAVVAHAVAREAQAGNLDPAGLTGLAKAYAKSCGMDRTAIESLRVEVGETAGEGGAEAGGALGSVVKQASGWTTVRVRARVRVPDSLRLLTGPVEMRSGVTCIVGTWKAPWTMIEKLLKLPDPRAAKQGA